MKKIAKLVLGLALVAGSLSTALSPNALADGDPPPGSTVCPPVCPK